MTEQYNWDLLGKVFKEDAEALRADRKKVIEAVMAIKTDLVDFLDCQEIKPAEYNAINTVLELVK